MTQTGIWLKRFGRVVRDLDSNRFLESFIAALKPVAPVESLLILIFRRLAPPVVLYEAMNSPEHDMFYEHYLKGGYVFSPYYRLWRRDGSDGFYLMREILPDDFTETAVFKNYYMHTGLQDEGAYLVRLDRDNAVIVSVGLCYRNFTLDELTVYRAIEPLVSGCAARYWSRYSEFIPSGSDPGRQFHQRLENALDNFGNSLLSEREAEIVQLFLKGYSNRSVAERLNIAQGTVKNHRNNIYFKLDVNSQSELFSLFIQSISHEGATDDADPLAAFMKKSKVKSIRRVS